MKSIIVALALFLGTQPLMAAPSSAKNQVIELQVTENGFEPSTVDVIPGIPVVLKIIRKTDATCATQIKIPTLKIKEDLPLNKTVSIEVGKLEKGEIRFACGMDMITGLIHVR